MKKSRYIKCILILSLTVLFVSGCGEENGYRTMNYKETKTMVVDILKSDEAKEILEESLTKQEEKNNGEMMRLLSTPQGKQIQQSVREILTDPEYPKILEDMMKDPKFAGEFAKAVMEKNKELHKQLMKDPEYQKLLVEVMKDEEFKKMIQETLKSKEYRKQTMTIMQEAIESPLFRLELMELMKKVSEEESKPKEEKKKEEESGGGSESEKGGESGES